MLGMITPSRLMVLVLYLSRAPLIIKYWGNTQGAKHSDELRTNLPERLRYITDNYNHLFEQPVLFYAAALYIHLAGHVDLIHVRCAWIYFVFRVVHSIVQATSNNVATRLIMFTGASLALATMIVREAIVWLGG